MLARVDEWLAGVGGGWRGLDDLWRESGAARAELMSPTPLFGVHSASAAAQRPARRPGTQHPGVLWCRLSQTGPCQEPPHNSCSEVRDPAVANQLVEDAHYTIAHDMARNTAQACLRRAGDNCAVSQGLGNVCKVGGARRPFNSFFSLRYHTQI